MEAETPLKVELRSDTTVRSAQDSANEEVNSPNLSAAWKYWKKKQGSAEHNNRKLSSVDPLEIPGSSQSQTPIANGDPQIRPEQSQQQQVNATTSKPTPGTAQSTTQEQGTVPPKDGDQPQEQLPWHRWINPLAYIPNDTFNFPSNQMSMLPYQQERQLDNQSQHSSTLTTAASSDNGWFGWMWSKSKQSEEHLNQELLSSIELKKNLKEAKKAIHNPDSVWAWYQNHYNDRKDGEVSVLDTNTEASPAEMSKYPAHVAKINEEVGEVVPKLGECLREITYKTKVRIATELYYNYPTEKHIYIKKNQHKPLIQYILVISVVGGSKGSRGNLSAQTLSSLAAESIKDWYSDKETSYDFQVESVSLEAAKIHDNSFEDLFKLLINWREQFKKIDFIFFAGYDCSVPLAAKLLDILIQRNLFTTTKKFGLLSVDGIIPGPHLDDASKTSISYCSDFNQILKSLLEQHNVKLTIIGTLNSIPGSLAIHLRHPNIFRSIHMLGSNYDNTFEVNLFQILLISHNLGHPTTRLLIQLNKFFSSSTNIAEHLDKNDFANAINNALSTTSLLRPKKVTLDIINDSILDNEYNLIWTLHAFVDDFKKIKNINSHNWVASFIESYKTWDPQSKSLKELKYMLEVLKIEDYCGALL